MPLQLKTNGDKIIWHNRKSSPRFCRTIPIVFEKETTLQTRREISATESQIEGLQPTVIYVGGKNSAQRIHYDLKMTMIDGKTISAYTGKSVQTCSICDATPKLMNDLPSIFNRPKDTTQYNFGVSSLTTTLCLHCDSINIAEIIYYKNKILKLISILFSVTPIETYSCRSCLVKKNKRKSCIVVSKFLLFALLVWYTINYYSELQ